MEGVGKRHSEGVPSIDVESLRTCIHQVYEEPKPKHVHLSV